MGTGTYNVSRFLRELGLKNVAEMPVRETVQPVLPLGSMYGQVPVHVASVCMWGGIGIPVGGTFTRYEITCLDPGGGILQAVWQVAPVLSFEIQLTTTPVGWDVGPTLLAPVHFTNEPTPSIANIGNTAAGVGIDHPRFDFEVGRSAFAPLFVPRGSQVQIVSEALNVGARVNFLWCGITATEGAPT